MFKHLIRSFGMVLKDTVLMAAINYDLIINK